MTTMFSLSPCKRGQYVSPAKVVAKLTGCPFSFRGCAGEQDLEQLIRDYGVSWL